MCAHFFPAYISIFYLLWCELIKIWRKNGIHLVIITSRSACFSLCSFIVDIWYGYRKWNEITNKIRNNHNSTQCRTIERRKKLITLSMCKNTLNFIVLSSNQTNEIMVQKKRIERTLLRLEHLPNGQICVLFRNDWLCSFLLVLILFEIKSLLFFILSIKFRKKTLWECHTLFAKKKLPKKLNTMFIF